MPDNRITVAGFPLVRGGKPVELPRTLRVDVPTSETDGVGVCDLRALQQPGQLQSVQGVAFCNESTAFYRLTHDQTGFSIIIPPESQGTLPLLATEQLLFTLTSTPFTAAPLRLWFLNTPCAAELLPTNGVESVQVTRALPAGTAAIGRTVGIMDASSGSATQMHRQSLATTNVQAIRNARCTLSRVSLWNRGDTDAYLKLFNKVGAPVLGTDVPVDILFAPPRSALNFSVGSVGAFYSAGLSIAITANSAPDDATALLMTGMVGVTLQYT